MKKHVAQYLNEILSITIMLLLAIALIAGQASPVTGGVADGSDRKSYQAVTVPTDE